MWRWVGKGHVTATEGKQVLAGQVGEDEKSEDRWWTCGEWQ